MKPTLTYLHSLPSLSLTSSQKSTIFTEEEMFIPYLSSPQGHRPRNPKTAIEYAAHRFLLKYKRLKIPISISLPSFSAKICHFHINTLWIFVSLGCRRSKQSSPGRHPSRSTLRRLWLILNPIQVVIRWLPKMEIEVRPYCSTKLEIQPMFGFVRITSSLPPLSGNDQCFGHSNHSNHLQYLV
jgi:hypothetical protein